MPRAPEILWEADPHTMAKHELLKYYLKAWFPILGSRRQRVVYFDGFAGPGEYAGGEPGSPIIALDVAANHVLNLPKCQFIFAEDDSARCSHLQSTVEAMDVPGNISWEVRNEPCEDALVSLLDDLDVLGVRLAPLFAFIDPFGIKGVPFRLIERLLRGQRSELLLIFMKKTIARFVGSYPHRVNELIGMDHAADTISQADDRIAAARALYQEALEGVAEYVRFFEMRDRRNTPVYDVFFATHHQRGIEVMVRSMWRVDNSGSFSFSDFTDRTQGRLFPQEPERDLAPLLWERLRGKTVSSTEAIAAGWELSYTDSHTKKALKLLEKGALGTSMSVSVEPKKTDGGKRVSLTFPKGVIIHFSK